MKTVQLDPSARESPPPPVDLVPWTPKPFGLVRDSEPDWSDHHDGRAELPATETEDRSTATGTTVREGTHSPTTRQGGSDAEAFLLIASVEGTLAGLSALTAYAPNSGLLVALLGPASLSTRSDENDAPRIAICAGIVALGLGNVVMGRSDLTRGERFWVNMAAWQGLLAAAYFAFDPPPNNAAPGAPRLSVGFGAAGDHPMLVVGGRF